MLSHYPKSSLSVAAVCALVWSCGGGRSPTQPSPTPLPTATPTPAPVPTPTPAATPTPSTDPREGLAPGPVTRFNIKLHSVRRPDGTELEEPFPADAEGYRVIPGDFIVFDSTQKNDAGEICQWVNDPEWKVEDPNRAVDRRPSSNPFLLRLDIVRTGKFIVTASVDGIVAPQVIILRSRVP